MFLRELEIRVHFKGWNGPLIMETDNIHSFKQFFFRGNAKCPLFSITLIISLFQKRRKKGREEGSKSKTEGQRRKEGRNGERVKKKERERGRKEGREREGEKERGKEAEWPQGCAWLWWNGRAGLNLSVAGSDSQCPASEVCSCWVLKGNEIRSSHRTFHTFISLGVPEWPTRMGCSAVCIWPCEKPLGSEEEITHCLCAVSWNTSKVWPRRC